MRFEIELESDTQMVRFDFLGTTRDSDAGSFVDYKLEEELECFRCIESFFVRNVSLRRE
jgi:hypothetical protein